MGMVAARVLTVLASALSVAAALHAQAVSGVLVEKGNGRPIRGAFVVLLDERDGEVMRTLTDDAGRFLLRAPNAGTYRLQSKRIGFRLFASEPLTLAADQTLAYRVEVAAVPAMLPPVIVEGRPQCGSRGAAGSVTARLWEEAREALAAVSWTSGEGRHRYQLLHFVREYGPIGRQVVKDSSWSSSGYSDSPFTSLPARQLADVGYVVAGRRDTMDYYAPDAAVLLSDVFLDTHCFTAIEGTAEYTGLVGLAFEPAPARRLPEVDGVLWFDRSNAELRHLEFEYTNLPSWLPEGALGGRVEFMRLTEGGWIVRQWWIRMAKMGRIVYRDTGRLPEPKVLGYREHGGQVSSIRTPRGTLAYSAREAILEGTVFDSTRRVPLARATVFLEGSGDSTRSDDRGSFALNTSAEGAYAVSFRHPRLDSLGVTAPSVGAVLAPGVRTSVVLSVPREARIVEGLCATEPLREGERVMVGVVREGGSGRPVPGADVEIRWQTIGGTPGVTLQARTSRIATVADSAGRYVLCGVPLGLVTLRATASGVLTVESLFRFVEEGVWVGDNRYRSFPGRIWTAEISLKR